MQTFITSIYVVTVKSYETVNQSPGSIEMHGIMLLCRCVSLLVWMGFTQRECPLVFRRSSIYSRSAAALINCA